MIENNARAVPDEIKRLSAALRGQYVIERELGRGGMAFVYLAKDVKHQRKVAVKVLRPELSATLASQRFHREIQISGRLQHPHILAMFDSGAIAGQLYYVMPFVEGETLRERLLREMQLPVDQAVTITCEIAEALGYAHSHDVVHRDVKPDNILLSSKHAVVADFGVARAIAIAAEGDEITRGLAIGTPAYMSPEQAAGDALIDGRSDIYSLGCVLYEMLVGEPPFTGPSPQAVLARHILEPVKRITTVRPSVPLPLEEAAIKALSKAPADRFETAEQFAEALRVSISPATRTPTDRLSHRPSTGSLSRFNGPHGLGIAVLPFTNVGADADKEFFSDGMADELMNALARVPGLHVASRSSVFSVRGRQLSLAEIGKQLNVDTVLEGSVRWSGDGLRITAELNDVAQGRILWSGTFGRKLHDVFAIQEEITRAIVAELRTKLGEPDSELLIRTSTRNPDAYQSYLRGRYCWNQRTPQGLERALQFFSEALKSDPEYAFAHSGQADAYIALSQFQYAPPRAVLPKAEAAAKKAIELQESLAEAHLSLAHIYEVFHWQWVAAEKEFLRALDLDPSHSRAHAWYADCLMAQGRSGESFQWMDRARDLEPLSVPIEFQATTLLYRARRFDDAIAGYRRIIETEPQYYGAHVFIGFAFANGGRCEEGIVEMQRAIAAMGSIPGLETALGCCLAGAGRRDEATALLKRMLEKSTAEYVAPAFPTILHGALGESDAAFDWLGKAYEERSLLMALLQVEPCLDPLRGDSRFDAFRKKVFA
ncbi:MAG: protein kinase [Gemmatimonadaceae bacterium]